MSRGNDAPSNGDRGSKGIGGSRSDASRTSRSSIAMSVDRARAIHTHADSSGTNQDLNSRAMSAADRNNIDEVKGE